jgi:hypothetical protein
MIINLIHGFLRIYAASLAHFAVKNLNRFPLVENKVEEKNLILTLSRPILKFDEYWLQLLTISVNRRPVR